MCVNVHVSRTKANTTHQTSDIIGLITQKPISIISCRYLCLEHVQNYVGFCYVEFFFYWFFCTAELSQNVRIWTAPRRDNFVLWLKKYKFLPISKDSLVEDEQEYNLWYPQWNCTFDYFLLDIFVDLKLPEEARVCVGGYRELSNIIFMRLYEAYKRSDCLRAGRPRSRSSSPGRVKNFLFSTSSRPALGPTQPPIQWVPGHLSPGVKGPGREADYSPPTSAEVKKMWIYTSTPPYTFMA
jgi:hypothetical protein